MMNQTPARRSLGLVLAVAVLTVLMAGSHADSLFAGARPKPLDLQQQCAVDCQALAETAKTACLARGEDVVNCQAEADKLLLVCLQVRCDQGNGSPCTAQCEDGAKQILEFCRDNEQQPLPVCEARYDAFLGACVSRLCKAPSPTPSATPSCAERCNELAQSHYNNCILNSPTNVCAQQAQAVLASCIADTCSPSLVTKTATVTLTATSGTKTTTPGNPTATAQPTVADGSTVSPTPPTTGTVAASATPTPLKTGSPSATANPTLTACIATCTARGQQAYDECIAVGGSESECRAKQQSSMNSCFANCGAGTATVVANRTATRTPVPLTLCKQTCVAQANFFLHQCVAAGRSLDVCQVEAQAMLQQCSRNCNLGTAPAPFIPTSTSTPIFSSTQDCNGECNAAAEAFYKRCILNGGTVAFCQQQTTIIQNDCIQTRCVIQPSGTCLRNCEVGGANIYITCMRDGEARGGGDIRVCAARKQDYLKRCNGGCRGTVYPTPSSTPRGGPTRRP